LREPPATRGFLSAAVFTLPPTCASIVAVDMGTAIGKVSAEA
jgi:hypothetical protein